MLLDHFHSPLSEQRDWHGFHNAWATYISADLNQYLPGDWFAQTNVDFGIEIDVAALKESPHVVGSGAVTAAAGPVSWTPPEPALTIPLPLIGDVVEVQVFRTTSGRQLVGAVELVSPANKDRPESREAFVAKCRSLLGSGIGLVVVDIVTTRNADLHQQLLDLLGSPDNDRESGLYSAAYHPVERNETPNLDAWYESLSLGGPLPQMPLYLLGGPCLPMDLEKTYRRTCEEQRVPGPY